MAIHAYIPGTASISVPTYADLNSIGQHCMAKLAPGIYQHARLGTTFVVLDELTSQASRVEDSTMPSPVTAERERGVMRPSMVVRRPIPVTPFA